MSAHTALQMLPFIKSAQIDDVKKSGNNIEVMIVANCDKVDDDGDRFLPEAWTHPEDIAFFKTKAWIDWNHYSVLLGVKKGSPELIAQGARESIKARIGEPLDLRVEGDRLLTKSKLYHDNPYVQELLPALKAGSTRYGASVGCSGSASEFVKSKYGPKVYDRARIKHIAICPLMEARNDGTGIELLKSLKAILVSDDEDSKSYPVVGVPSIATFESPLVTNDFLALVQQYMMAQPDFYRFIYEGARIHFNPDAPDFDALRKYFRSLGVEESEASRVATQALLQFIAEGKAA